MEQDRTERERRRRGMSVSNVDGITAVVIFIIGAVMMWDNYKLGITWASNGPETGYFPYHIGAIICLSSVAVFFRTRYGRLRDDSVFVSWARFRLVLAVLAPTALYVLLIEFLGIYVASAIFIGSFMRILGHIGWLKTILTSVGVNLLLFWMFEIEFMVPLPKGPLEAFFGF